MISQLDFFLRQKEILERLFPVGWFREKSRFNHPAFRKWKFCDDLINQKLSIHSPEQDESLLDLGRILLDSSNLVTLTGGTQDELLMGDLNLYGDGPVQTKIRTRVFNPNQFEDVLLELTVAACHIQYGHRVTPLEVERHPDLRIDIPTLDHPVFAECKCLRSVSLNKFNKVIAKANSQLKAVDTPSFGVVYLDINSPMKIGIVKDTQIPSSVIEVRDRVAAALSGPKNRSVGAAVLIWDFYIVHGQPPDGTLVAFLRNYLRVSHTPQDCLRIIPDTCNLYAASMVLYTIDWRLAGSEGTAIREGL